jgi:hypothetical protein
VRVAIVFFAERKREKILPVVRAFAKGLEESGQRVDIIDGFQDINTRLTVYEYIAAGCESLSLFSGKISEKIAPFLSQAGTMAGKRCFAFTIKSPFAAFRALARLMKIMEKEGMLLTYSDIFSSPGYAREVGKKLMTR